MGVVIEVAKQFMQKSATTSHHLGHTLVLLGTLSEVVHQFRLPAFDFSTLGYVATVRPIFEKGCWVKEQTVMVKGVGGKSGCLIKTTPSRLIFHVHPIFPGVTKLCASTIFFLTKIMGRHIISFEKKAPVAVVVKALNWKNPLVFCCCCYWKSNPIFTDLSHKMNLHNFFAKNPIFARLHISRKKFYFLSFKWQQRNFFSSVCLFFYCEHKRNYQACKYLAIISHFLTGST